MNSGAATEVGLSQADLGVVTESADLSLGNESMAIPDLDAEGVTTTPAPEFSDEAISLASAVEEVDDPHVAVETLAGGDNIGGGSGRGVEIEQEIDPGDDEKEGSATDAAMDGGMGRGRQNEAEVRTSDSREEDIEDGVFRELKDDEVDSDATELKLKEIDENGDDKSGERTRDDVIADIKKLGDKDDQETRNRRSELAKELINMQDSRFEAVTTEEGKLADESGGEKLTEVQLKEQMNEAAGQILDKIIENGEVPDELIEQFQELRMQALEDSGLLTEDDRKALIEAFVSGNPRGRKAEEANRIAKEVQKRVAELRAAEERIKTMPKRVETLKQLKAELVAKANGLERKAKNDDKAREELYSTYVKIGNVIGQAMSLKSEVVFLEADRKWAKLQIRGMLDMNNPLQTVCQFVDAASSELAARMVSELGSVTKAI